MYSCVYKTEIDYCNNYHEYIYIIYNHYKQIIIKKNWRGSLNLKPLITQEQKNKNATVMIVSNIVLAAKAFIVVFLHNTSFERLFFNAETSETVTLLCSRTNVRSNFCLR